MTGVPLALRQVHRGHTGAFGQSVALQDLDPGLGFEVSISLAGMGAAPHSPNSRLETLLSPIGTSTSEA